MSKQLSLLQIEPNDIYRANDTEEIKVIAECPACNGEGSFKRSNSYHGSAKDEVATSDCIRCKGSGRLKADIVIRWTPDNNDGTN